MKRKLITNALVLAMIFALVLSGCSKNDPENSSEPTKAPEVTAAPVVEETPAPEVKKDPVTLRILVWSDAKKGLIDMFQAKYPWITVEPVYIADGGIMQTVLTAEAANTPIDVIWLDELAGYVKDDMLEDLKPYMDKDLALQSKVFINDNKFLDAFNIKGKRYAAPFIYVPTWMLVNTDLLAKNGMEMPANDWTLDDFRTMAKEATDTAAGEYGMAYSTLFGNFFTSVVAAANGHAANLPFMNEDLTQSLLGTPEVLADIAWVKELVTKDGSMPSHAKAKELGLVLNVDFIVGKSLFEMGGDWSLPDLQANAKFGWDVLPWPKGSAQQVTYGMIGAFGMAKASQHKDEAYLWISYQYEDEVQKWNIDQGANATVVNDELMNYYNETPMWKGKNISAVTDTNKFPCCVDRGQTIPSYGTNPWGATTNVILGDDTVDSLIPLAEAWNKQTLDVRKELGW